ncbi:MAG TPA: hypothetical protein VLH09_02570, partial [Bryobacteraceae bacterium]|nr:hypothetical protein [Bryobacteraceae bacterium]
IELEQSEGESSVMTYAWDLETNTRQTKVFTVRHVRHTRKGQYGLDDPREIYELTANQGARRLRACILGVIPGDVVEAAINECEKTMQGGNREPLADRIRAMLVAFADMGVTQGMIEARLGHRAEAIIETELVNLKKIYRSLKDNMASREDFFEVNGGKSSSVDDRLSRAANGNGNGNGNTHKPASQPQANDSTPAEAQGQPVQQTRHEPPQPEQKLAGTTGTLVVDPEVIAGEKPDTGAPGKLAWDYVRDVVPAKAPQGMEPDAARFTFSSYIRRTYAAGNKTAKVPEIWDSLTVEQQIGVMDLLESGDFPFVAKKQ